MNHSCVDSLLGVISPITTSKDMASGQNKKHNLFLHVFKENCQSPLILKLANIKMHFWPGMKK